MFNRLRRLYHEYPFQFWLMVFGVFLSTAGASMIAPFLMIYASEKLDLPLSELTVVPTASTYVANISPANLRGRYMSVYWLAWGISRGGAPLIGGWLNDHVSPQSIWVGGLLIGLTSAVGLLLLSRRKPEQSLVELPAT